jgi:glutamyl-tRNA synthetase
MLTRFAPSPTGYLHIGNARTALICSIVARKAGGKFMLRIDDTDLERSKAEYEEAIKEDLKWLSLEWDSFARQSERLARYEGVKQQMIASGRLYPCFETQEELEIRRKMQLTRGLPPVYDRAALKLTQEQIEANIAAGKKPHYRFKMAHKDIIWDDGIRGHTKFNGAHISDPIVIRETGAYTYMLPSTVDDADFKVTNVVRGEDHVSNTATQIQMFEAMGATVPNFMHLALIKGKEGKISKREGGFDIRSLRAEGIEPMAICSFLARVGTSDAIEARPDLNTLTQEFDAAKFSRSPATYDPLEIERLNAKIVHEMPYATIKNRVQVDEAFWNAVRSNLNKVEEANEWWKICNEEVKPTVDDFTRQAASLLPPEPWDSSTWNQWVEAVKAATGRKGKELFMPLRLALTGMEHGPELKDMLPLIGRERVLKRLN